MGRGSLESPSLYQPSLADPDCKLFARYQSFWRRLLFARLASNRVNLANTVRMALGKPLGYAYNLPFPPGAIRMLAGFNIACSLCGFRYTLAIACFDPLTGLVCHRHTLTSWGSLYTGLRPYVEHAGTGAGPFRDARTRTSPFFSILYFFNNYHLEHHLYPWVPCYRLPAVHRYLERRVIFAIRTWPSNRASSRLTRTLRPGRAIPVGYEAMNRRRSCSARGDRNDFVATMGTRTGASHAAARAAPAARDPRPGSRS